MFIATIPVILDNIVANYELVQNCNLLGDSVINERNFYK